MELSFQRPFAFKKLTCLHNLHINTRKKTRLVYFFADINFAIKSRLFIYDSWTCGKGNPSTHLHHQL